MKQKALAGASLAALIGLVATWEGLRTTAYQDIVGIWTVCYGETKGVKKGDKYTPEQCKSKLAHEIGEYEARLNKCMTRPLSDGERIALVSLSYNAGTGAVCKSTAMRLMNQGKRKEGCYALLKWSYAGGKFVQGLHNRRQAERKLCLTL
jgi:GH24 family phage-related lysozyme (muramidase)